MSTLSPTDPRTQRLQRLLSERIYYKRKGDKKGEKLVLQTLENELDFLRAKKIKAIPDNRLSFEGRNTGKRNPTTMVSTYMRNVNRRMMM